MTSAQQSSQASVEMLNSKSAPSKPWQPDSWKNFVASQQAIYPDPAHLAQTLGELEGLPPLVSANEIKQLRQKLALAAKGEAFVLQGGDCAELFQDCNAEKISQKLKILLQMSLILVHGLNRPIVKIGRMAGQYAKPRSQHIEKVNGEELLCYRGDLINEHTPTPNARQPNPDRLLKGYSFASLTLNYIRTLFDNHFADFSNIENWDLDFVSHAKNAKDYRKVLKQIQHSQSLLKNLQTSAPVSLPTDRIFTCHEALHLHYEHALTRQDENGDWYNMSTHLPWIGMRTSQLDSAHVEYMRGINNPVAIKISDKLTPDILLDLINKLDPNNTPGRLMLITRMGCDAIETKLPPLIRAVKSRNLNPVWCCDPMHGNTQKTATGVKTRRFDDITSELTKAFKIHKENNSHLGGLHFELTGEAVTECVGGARGLIESDLKRAYKSLVDPRLNPEQAIEIALLISQLNH